MNPLSRGGPISSRNLSAVLAALEILAGTGILVKTGAATFAVRTLQEGTGIDITLPDGVAGNPTITLDLSETNTDALPEGAVNLYFTNERVDDRVAALLVEGAGIDFVYNDAGNSLTLTVDLSELSTTTLPEGTNLYFTNERAQDAVGTILTNGGGLTWTYNDAGNTISAVVSITSTSVTDFNEAAQDAVGAILTNGGGLTWTYNDAANTISAVVSLTSGSITDFTEAVQDVVGAYVVDSATVDFTYDDVANTLTAIVIDNSIGNTKLRDSAALSVIGRAANSVGDPADIAAGADDTFLRRTGSTLNFGVLTIGMVPNDLITYAKIQNVSTNGRVLGRTTAGAGDIEELSAGAGISIAGGTISSTITQYTDELAQDAIGAALLDTATIDLVYDDVGNTISANVINGSITFAKMQNINTDTLIGRDTAGAGSPESITVGGGIEFSGTLQLRTSAFTGDVTKAAGGTVLTIANDVVTDAKLRNSGALTVIGRAVNSIGDPADIAAAADDTIFRRTASTLSFGQLTVGMFPNDLVTYAKIQNVSATSRVLGRITAGAGDIEELTPANLVTLINTADGTGSGLDADLLDGLHASAFATKYKHTHTADLTIGDGESYVVSNVFRLETDGNRVTVNGDGRLAVC